MFSLRKGALEILLYATLYMLKLHIQSVQIVLLIQYKKHIYYMVYVHIHTHMQILIYSSYNWQDCMLVAPNARKE